MTTAASTTTAVTATTTTAVTATTATAVIAATTAPTGLKADPFVDRPFDVFVPSRYDAAEALPLIVLLHGYTASGVLQEAYLKFQALAEQRRFLYVHPDGTKDSLGQQFWNATDACCNLAGASVDDSAYLAALIERVRAMYNVDPKRIYLVGHSNGGFMSYRMACDHATTFAAIVSIAGATFADSSRCQPAAPINVLQIHGTSDGTIHYEGGNILGHTYPSAGTTVATWAAYDGCGSTPISSPDKLDLEDTISGAETSVSTFTGCTAGGSVTLWTITGAGHVPVISPTFSSDIVDFLYAHPKP
jgi:polyhydroxybutyrate depolymerase